MNTHFVGIIGYGGFGQFLHNAWSTLPNAEVVAAADRITPKNLGTLRYYQDWPQLLTDPDVEIVVIATPPATHAQMACAALEAGKHVLVEKPLATKTNDAQQILDVQKKTGRIATIDYMMRFNPIIETLAHFAQEKTFGHLRRVAVENYAQDELLPSGHWFWNRGSSGGILIEHAVHFIDLVHYLSPQPFQHVTGGAHRRNPQQEDIVVANVIYPDGLVATHYHSFTRPGFFEITTIRFGFDLAQIDIQGWIPLSGQITALVNEATKTKLALLPDPEILETTQVAKIQDISRPEGWGADKDTNSSGRKQIHSRGNPYTVDELVRASFDLGQPKHVVYAEGVRRVLQDLIQKIEDPKHQLRVTLEDGLTSLQIAELATQRESSDAAI